jgi:transposase
MTKYREILRMDSLGLSGRSISASLGCSRNTVSEVLCRAVSKGVKWPISLDVDDNQLEQLLFP